MEGFVHNGHQPKRDIVDRQFLVACAQGAILLVPTHYLLHDMPLPIGCLVELLVPWLVASCRDHGLDSPLATPESDAWVAITFVRRQLARPATLALAVMKQSAGHR